MRFSLLVVCLLLIHPAFSQSVDYEFTPFAEDEYQISAKSGLRMRAGPSIDSKVVTSIPYGEFVEVGYPSKNHQVIEENKGGWRPAKWKQYTGYLFDGFMEKVSTPDIEGFIPGLGVGSGWGRPLLMEPRGAWWGLYLADDPSPDFNNRPGVPMQTYEFKLLSEGIDTTVNGKGYSWINRDFKERPLLVFAGLQPPEGLETRGAAMQKMLFPGEVMRIDNWILFAEGTPVRHQREEGYAFDSIEGYRLSVRGKTSGGWSDQQFFNTQVYSWEPGSYEGNFHLHFVGDLDNDGIKDILFSFGPVYKGWDYILFLSKSARKGEFYRPVVIGQASSC